MEETKWVERWKYWIAPKPSRPGVWRMKGGGYLVRGRATDFRTGKKREVMRTVKDTDVAGAYKQLQEMLDEVRSGAGRREIPRMRFSEYAASLFERKVLKGEVESAQTRENWELMLRLHLFPTFGEVFVDAISKADVETWLAGEARKVKAGAYSPVTVNNWLRLFRGIMNEAVDELGLAKNPFEGQGARYQRARHPYGGGAERALARGSRTIPPGNTRSASPAPRDGGAWVRHRVVAIDDAPPLRRKGSSADVLWDTGVVLARRSQTRGDEVREATKNATRFRVTLPADVMAVLRWHADRLPAGPMRESDLLFPSETGGFRSPTVLDKPFKDVCRHLSLGKKVTRALCGERSRTSPAWRRSMDSFSAASAGTSPRR